MMRKHRFRECSLRGVPDSKFLFRLRLVHADVRTHFTQYAAAATYVEYLLTSKDASRINRGIKIVFISDLCLMHA